jgi:signal transduction histidine kinase
MQAVSHPDAINTRLVLRIYAWIVTTIGVSFMDGFPFFIVAARADYDLPGYPWGRVGAMRLGAAAVAALGFTAIGLSRIDSPVSRQRALYWFAIAHIVPGLVFFAASSAMFDSFVPPAVQWAPLAVGVVLMYVAATSAHAPRLHRPFQKLVGQEIQGPVLVARGRGGSLGELRSQYEQQILQAARLEERARLARDLHDAVKQQLFAIQTSTATAQERFTTDPDGTRAALEQVRASTRDAMTEMDALIGQLEAAPLENTGLVAALTQQCEALSLRTGADVKFETDVLPPSDRLPPGAQQALFRAAQEALANVARHARATHIVVRLGLSRHNLELSIRDNGAGFDPTATTSGMGFRNMGARIADVAGTILVHSAKGRGTTIAFSVPWDASTPRDYARKAALWIGISAVSVAVLRVFGNWNGPWYAIVVAVTAITAGRFIAAWFRVRHQAAGVA